MARQTIVLQVFVASPSDVGPERDLMEGVVAQLNQTWSSTLGVTYELLKWENSVRPAFSTDPQAAINEQIGCEYDVFIGIFWGRIGTSTPRATSGTIEEFERALERRKLNGNTPEIMLYFKDAPISPSKMNIEQLQQVLDFKKSVAPMGGLYSEFEDEAGFESSLRVHLSAIAQDFVKRSSKAASIVQHAPPVTQPNMLGEIEEDDYGYMDYFEIYESRQADMLSAITIITEATVRIGEQIAARTAETLAADRSDQREARRLIKRVADDMTSYAATMRIQLPILSTSRESAFAALSNALAMQDDSKEMDEGLHLLKNMLFGLVNGLEGADEGTTGFKAAVIELPRLTKEINAAKRIVAHELDAFLVEVDSTRSTVANIIESIDRMLSSKTDAAVST